MDAIDTHIAANAPESVSTVWKWTKNDAPRAIIRTNYPNIDCLTKWRYHNGRFIRKLYPKTFILATVIVTCLFVRNYYETTEQARSAERYSIRQQINSKLVPQNVIIEKMRNEVNNNAPDYEYIRRQIKKLRQHTF